MKTLRCKTLVQEELNNLGIYNITVELGIVELSENLPEEKLKLFDTAIRNAGLELLKDKRLQLVDDIKAAIYDLVYHSDDIPKPNYSDFISQKVNLSYASLSNTFSKTQGKTIEKYIIEQRIERVKELLIYTDLSIDEMVFKLNYSSSAHLSNQFKKFTGMTPSFFRKNKNPSSSPRNLPE